MKVAFLVDGFNLYHSVRTASDELGRNCRWLDPWSLFTSYLPYMSSKATLQEVHYFTALAHHVESRNPGTIKRHEAYLRALKARGVVTYQASFKEKPFYYRNDEDGIFLKWIRHVEKETDVAIASKLLELAIGQSIEALVVVSGDSDLVPAVRTSLSLRPKKPVYALFPAYRGSDALKRAVTGRFRIKPDAYQRHQLPNPVRAPEGWEVYRPPEWA